MAKNTTTPKQMASPQTADQTPNQKQHDKQPQGGGKKGNNNVLQLTGTCMADGCSKKSEKAGFCMEHFDWFKEGLITKEGRKPSDFEKKYFNYQQRKRAA